MRLTGWITWRTMAMRAETAATLRQIAQCYFPHALDRSAVQQLRRWIQADPQLRRALRAAGVRRGQRVFSARQQRVFRQWLG